MKKYDGGRRYGGEGDMEESWVWRGGGMEGRDVWRRWRYGREGGMEEREAWRREGMEERKVWWRGRYGGEGVWRRGRYGGREKIGKERKIDIVQTE